MLNRCITGKAFYFMDTSVTGSVASSLCRLLSSINNREMFKKIVHGPLQCNNSSAVSAKPTETQFISGYSQRYNDYLVSSQYNK